MPTLHTWAFSLAITFDAVRSAATIPMCGYLNKPNGCFKVIMETDYFCYANQMCQNEENMSGDHAYLIGHEYASMERYFGPMWTKFNKFMDTSTTVPNHKDWSTGDLYNSKLPNDATVDGDLTSNNVPALSYDPANGVLRPVSQTPNRMKVVCILKTDIKMMNRPIVQHSFREYTNVEQQMVANRNTWSDGCLEEHTTSNLDGCILL